MKILYYFKEQDTVMFQWQRKHIFNELTKHGFQIDVFNPLKFKNFDEANERLMQVVREESYQLFMTPHNEDVLYIDTLNYINKKGIHTLLICFDNLVIPFHWKKISKFFNLVWLTSYETKYLFDRWGCNTIFLPYAANPFFLKPHKTEEVPCIGFIGTPYGSRIHRINIFLENGIDMCIHSKVINTDLSTKKTSTSEYIKALYNYIRYPIGRRIAFASFKQKIMKKELLINNRQLTLKGPVELESMGDYLSNYALSLAFSDTKSTGVLKRNVPIVNLRSFEIPMAGGLQIATYSEELASYFEDGKEIILCKNNEEYVEKAKFYLREDNVVLRDKMKIKARQRAESEHTWYCRFKKVFDYFGLEYK